MEENLTFSAALVRLKKGDRIARAGWNAHHSLWLQEPDANSANTRPYIYLVVGDDAADMPGARVPWVASQTDLLAEDWHVVAEADTHG